MKRQTPGSETFVILVFYLAVLASLFIPKNNVFETPQSHINLNQFGTLLNGSNAEHEPLGHQLAPLKERLPKSGTIGFLTGVPIKDASKNTSEFYKIAQRYLSPLILDPTTEHPYAIIYGENKQLVEQKLKALNYQWIAQVSDRFGIVKKAAA